MQAVNYEWVIIVIDGVFVPTQKNDAATNNKPDDTYKEDFRALLKDEDKPSSNKSIRATHLNSTSAQATTPNINPVETFSDQGTQVDNTSTTATDANAALLGLNIVTPQSSTPTLGLEQPATSQNAQTAIASNQLSSQLNVIGNEAAQTDAQSANNGAKTGAHTNAATLNETGAKLASSISSIKGGETSVSQAELAQLTQNNAKQSATTLTSSANTTNTSTPTTTLTSAQSVTNTVQSQPIAQGASAQFLQAAKTGNTTGAAIGKTSSAGSNGISAATSTAATSASSPSAAPTVANVTPVVGAQAAVPNNVLPTLNTAAQDVLAALPDSDTIDGLELGTKDSSAQSTSLTATTKTPDLPPGLRNASPVTQQAWAGLISRMDGKSHQFQIRLDPAELGRINVSIEITKDKKATVVLAARSAEALAELSKGARSLEAALADAGVELEEGGLKLEMSSDESSSFTFSDDDGSETKNNGDGQTNASASQEADNDAPRQITPEITAWSRQRVNLTA